MYDTTDGLKAGILKDVNTIATDSIYRYTQTVSNSKVWISIKAPELKQSIIIYSPRYNPLLGE